MKPAWSRPWSAGRSASCESLPQLRGGLRQSLVHDLDVVDDRHEVRVAVPARHDVKVHVVGNPGAGRAPDVRSNVEALGVERAAQYIDGAAQRAHQQGGLLIVQLLEP